MKQTAVQTLVEQLRFTHKEAYNDLYEVIQQALEMEKQQIIEAWIATDNPLQRMSAEQYYNETYGGNK
jgi:hypothetical protein